jgi:hypothetical protein
MSGRAVLEDAVVKKMTFLVIVAGLLLVMGQVHAGKPGGKPPKDDGGKPVPLSVAVVKHETSPASTLYDPGLSCVAGTNGMNVVFPRHDLCATLTTTTSDTIEDDIIIYVSRDKKSGDVVSAHVEGQDTIGSEGLMHKSDEMVPLKVTNHPDGSFTVHLHADKVMLWKCDTHLSKPQSVCIDPKGMFAIDDLYYFPDP